MCGVSGPTAADPGGIRFSSDIGEGRVCFQDGQSSQTMDSALMRLVPVLTDTQSPPLLRWDVLLQRLVCW